MKLIDKYILTTFLVPFFYCLGGFAMLYVVYDLFDNLKDFIHAGTPIRHILKFYLMIMPSAAVFIVPVSLLLAVLYALSQLTRHNELTAMRASGVSLYRLLIPIMSTGVVCSLLVALNHETLGPWSMHWTRQFINSQKHQDLNTHVVDNLPYKNAIAKRVWLLGGFNLNTLEMEDVRVTQQRDDGTELYSVQAKKGQWLDGRWWFSDLAVQKYDQWGNPMGAPKYEMRREMTELEETPRDFLNETRDPEFLPSRDLSKYIRTHQHLSKDTLARFRTDLYHRLATPWACLVVSLIGIPFGNHTGRKGALAGVSMCIGLFFGYYVISNLALALGKKMIIAPSIAAFGPMVIFLALAGFMISRLR